MISEQVPSMNRDHLEGKFAPQDHGGNSKSYLDEGLHESERGYIEDMPQDEEFDIYEGGRCHYDPYFIYGFGRFGEMDLSDPFDIDDLWKIHEVEHLALDEDDPFSHGHYDHDFGDEFYQYDDYDAGMYDQFDELVDIDEADFDLDGMHDDGFDDFEMDY